MDFNSIKNQHIKEKFVGNHVYACVTSMIEFVLTASQSLSDAPVTMDELDSSYYYEDSQGTQYSEQEREERIVELTDELEDAEDALLVEQQIAELEDLSPIYPEIYEWWIVSPFLAGKLAAYGQTVLDDGMNRYWGRCTTGQAILLDRVISEICRDMEILEGQVHQW